MVAQNMLRAHKGKYVISRRKEPPISRSNQMPSTDQIPIWLLTCASISELPSNTITMVSINAERMGTEEAKNMYEINILLFISIFILLFICIGAKLLFEHVCSSLTHSVTQLCNLCLKPHNS